MAINRIIDNSSVGIASLNRKSVISSREMALSHPKKNGATLFGINSKYTQNNVCDLSFVSWL